MPPGARPRSPSSASRTGSAARSTTCGPSAPRSPCRSSPRSSSSTRASCPCCARPAPTSSCSSRRSTRRDASPTSSPGPATSASSRSSRSTPSASSTPRSRRVRAWSASTRGTCGRSPSTRTTRSGCAARIPDDRLVIAESGVREPATIARWRAAGFDAALVGEALVRAADPRAAAAAFVAAGAVPDDPGAAHRIPFVKICGIVDDAGLDAALAAGADAIGLNFVEGTPRALSLAEGAALARRARAAGGTRAPAITAIVANADDGAARRAGGRGRRRRLPARRRRAAGGRRRACRARRGR